MVMNALPEIAKNVAQPLSKVDKITMYGEGNSAKLLEDIINGTTRVPQGIAQGMGIEHQGAALRHAWRESGRGEPGAPAPVAVVVPAEEPAPSPQEAQEAEKPQ